MLPEARRNKKPFFSPSRSARGNVVLLTPWVWTWTSRAIRDTLYSLKPSSAVWLLGQHEENPRETEQQQCKDSLARNLPIQVWVSHLDDRKIPHIRTRPKQTQGNSSVDGSLWEGTNLYLDAYPATYQPHKLQNFICLCFSFIFIGKMRKASIIKAFRWVGIIDDSQ